MKMVAAREAEEISRGELGAYYSADVPDMPKPPYQFQVQSPRLIFCWMPHPSILRSKIEIESCNQISPSNLALESRGGVSRSDLAIEFLDRILM